MRAKAGTRAKTGTALKKAGLAKTKAQRRAERAALERHLDYRIPRLSDLVNRPSRFRVKERQPVYKVEKERQPSQRTARTHWFTGDIVRNIWGEPVYDYTPGKEVARKTLAGERLVVKRLAKRGAKRKESQRGQGAAKTGSAASIRARAKASKKKKRGARPGREKKKTKKKKK